MASIQPLIRGYALTAYMIDHDWMKLNKIDYSILNISQYTQSESEVLR